MDTSLSPIVSSNNTPTYNLGRVRIPLMGKTQYHVKDSDDLVRKLTHVRIAEDKCMVSFDVKSLFTKLPIDEAVIIIHDKLSADDTLSQRTPLSADKSSQSLQHSVLNQYISNM